jgi:hypothetical protein
MLPHDQLMETPKDIAHMDTSRRRKARCRIVIGIGITGKSLSGRAITGDPGRLSRLIDEV